MKNKKKQVGVERILYDVEYTLAIIIEKNKGSFKKEGNFKVRPGYGYDKFYLDRVDGSYDMSLHGLIHYILHDEHLYEKFLSEKQLEDQVAMTKEFPESIYSPNDDDDDYAKIQYEYLDVIYWRSIQFVAKRLMKEGFDVEEDFLDYL